MAAATLTVGVAQPDPRLGVHQDAGRAVGAVDERVADGRAVAARPRGRLAVGVHRGDAAAEALELGAVLVGPAGRADPGVVNKRQAIRQVSAPDLNRATV